MNVKDLLLDSMESVTDWTATTSSTTNLAVSTTRMTGTYSVEFDKKSDTEVDAGAYGSLSEGKLNLDQRWAVRPYDRVVWTLYVSSTADIDYAYVKLGTAVSGAAMSNYNEYRVADSLLIAGWNICDVPVGDAYLGGTGWNPSAVDGVEVGVALDAGDDTLADIKVDRIEIVRGGFSRA